MTDELTPREEEVRRLLADARHVQPLPDDVAARLDATLADLAAEPARLTPVSRLADRRRRAAGMLVAAAAVVVVGIGVGQVLGGTGSEGDSATAGSSADDGGGTTTEDRVLEGTDQEVPEAAEPAPALPEAQSGAAERDAVVELRADAFARGVEEAGRQLDLSADDQAQDGAALGALRGSVGQRRAWAAAAACGAEAWGRGRFVPVRYDGVPAVLVFRRADGDRQVADLFLCGSTEPERSLALPAP